jgi:hypothetical protein
MLTNTISIIDLAPTYSKENLKLILDRVGIIFPNLESKGQEPALRSWEKY